MLDPSVPRCTLLYFSANNGPLVTFKSCRVSFRGSVLVFAWERGFIRCCSVADWTEAGGKIPCAFFNPNYRSLFNWAILSAQCAYSAQGAKIDGAAGLMQQRHIVLSPSAEFHLGSYTSKSKSSRKFKRAISFKFKGVLKIKKLCFGILNAHR